MKGSLKNQEGVAPLFVVLIIVAVLAVGAIGWYVFSRNNNDSGTNGDDTNGITEETVEGSFFDAIATSNPMECDWTLNYEGEALVTNGKLYTDGANRGRSEATYQDSGQTSQSYTLVDSNYIYNWVSGQGSASGTRVDRSNVEGNAVQENLFKASPSVDLNADYTFDCKAWTVDDTKLTPPSDVNFVEL